MRSAYPGYTTGGMLAATRSITNGGQSMHPLLTAACLVVGCIAAPAWAQERAITLETYQAALQQAQGHPNELARWHGLWAYDNGRMEEARQQFERAASYGDKLSRHLLTMMYWNGEGVDRDPVQAYIWADLAADGSDNPDLVGMRERIWSALTVEQRAQVLEQGPRFYERYGDEAARERTNRELRRFARNQTGSRTGQLTSPLTVSLGRPEFWAGGGGTRPGPARSDGTTFYADQRMRPDAYWAQEELDLRALMKRIGAGTVNVGEVDKVTAPAPDESTP